MKEGLLLILSYHTQNKPFTCFSSLIVALERHWNLPQIDNNALTGSPASLLDALRLVPDP